MTFERDGGDPVSVIFKFERLGIFCFVCGLLGHTENFCPKRFDADFDEEAERGWGNYLRAELGGTGGAVGVNKWLRGGRGGMVGGRGGRGNQESTRFTNGTSTNTAVTHPNAVKYVQHTMYGRVKIGRESGKRGLVLSKLVTTPRENEGMSEEWVPFIITVPEMENRLRLIADQFRHTQMGEVAMLETQIQSSLIVSNEANVTNDLGTQNQLLMITHSKEDNNNDGTNLASKDAATVKQANAGLKLDNMMPMLNDKGAVKANEGVPKKRFRTADEGHEANTETTSAIGNDAEDMKIDGGTECSGANDNGFLLHTNPLYSEKIVMAGAGSQARQLK
jgi:hypothetical protein